jgi:hypothetical protein
MDNSKPFYVLKSVKLSLLSRKGQLVNLLDSKSNSDSVPVINDQIAWLDVMISSVETEMEQLLIPEIPF